MPNHDEKILDGQSLSRNILLKIRSTVGTKKLKLSLAIILIGDDASSKLYVKLKKKACEACGIGFHSYLFPENTKESEIIETIQFLNNDPEVTGILVQLPLPEKFNTEKIIEAIDPIKDADGFHSASLAKIKAGDTTIASPMIEGIIELLRNTKQELSNKQVTILCNNKLFGEPFQYFFDKSNIISVVTTEDADYKEKIKRADILIVGIGLTMFITADMVKDGVIIIDNGINKLPESDTVLGDVDFFGVLPKVSFISPVPGGVGPMTVAMLLSNLLKLHELQSSN